MLLGYQNVKEVNELQNIASDLGTVENFQKTSCRRNYTENKAESKTFFFSQRKKHVKKLFITFYNFITIVIAVMKSKIIIQVILFVSFEAR